MTDWHTRFQRSQQLARRLAERGYQVLFLNPHLGRQFETVPLVDKSHRISDLGNGIQEIHVRLPREPVYHHRLLREAESALVRRVVDNTVRRCGTLAPLQIVSFPAWIESAAGIRDQSGGSIIYDCHDRLDMLPKVAREICDWEAVALERADLILFSSQRLFEYHVGMNPELERKALLVRNGVDCQFFDSCPAPDSAASSGPVAGYVGALEHWLDVEMLAAAARGNPHCRFQLVGRLENRRLLKLKRFSNVEFLGEVPYQQVPGVMSKFTIGLIPFVLNELTQAVNPIKLYEYFCGGLPVVSSPLPEVQLYGDHVYLASSPERFAEQVQAALAENDLSRRQARRRIAMSEDWSSRLDLILRRLSRDHSLSGGPGLPPLLKSS